MTEVINLRKARKRAAHDKANRSAAESRLAHGVSKMERTRIAADKESSQRMLNQHKRNTGDSR